MYHTITLDTPTTLSAFAFCMVARNDPEFFHRAVKDLTIGKFELEHFPQESTELDKSMTVIFKACTGIERCSYWGPAKVHQSWRYLLPNYISFIPESELPPLPTTSASLTHLHLDFALFVRHPVNAWPHLFKKSPGLAHLQLSGGALESVHPQTFDSIINPIVSVLPQTLTRLIVIATSLRAHANGVRITVRLKALRGEPRIAFILSTPHTLDTVEELRSHETNRDAYFTREDIHCEEFRARYLDVGSDA